jgi:hypothetical protein
MAKLAKRIKSWRLAAMAGAAGASLLASRQAHAEWVMGTVQQSTTYFTEVATFFQVPNAPTSGTTSAESAIWPGLWCSNEDLIQPVLAYNYNSTVGWTMHNEVATGSGQGGIHDEPSRVSPGDEIMAIVYLDSNNEGNCNKATGANCNYNSFWEDFTNGTYENMSREWTVTSGPKWAMGIVFETPLGSFNSCADLPGGGMETYSSLEEYTPSNQFASVAPNFTVETPTNSTFFQFSNQGLNDGGNAFPTCVNITYPFGRGNNEAMLWLNAY